MSDIESQAKQVRFHSPPAGAGHIDETPIARHQKHRSNSCIQGVGLHGKIEITSDNEGEGGGISDSLHVSNSPQHDEHIVKTILKKEGTQRHDKGVANSEILGIPQVFGKNRICYHGD